MTYERFVGVVVVVLFAAFMTSVAIYKTESVPDAPVKATR